MSAITTALLTVLRGSVVSVATATVASTAMTAAVVVPMGVQAVRADPVVAALAESPVRSDDPRFPEPVDLPFSLPDNADNTLAQGPDDDGGGAPGAVDGGDDGTGDDTGSGSDPGSDSNGDGGGGDTGDESDGEGDTDTGSDGDGDGGGDTDTGSGGDGDGGGDADGGGNDGPDPTPTVNPTPPDPDPTPVRPTPTATPDPSPTTPPTPRPTAPPTPTPRPTPTPTAPPTPTPTPPPTPTPTPPSGAVADLYVNILNRPAMSVGTATLVETKVNNSGPDSSNGTVTIRAQGATMSGVVELGVGWSCTRVDARAFVCAGPIAPSSPAFKRVTLVPEGGGNVVLTLTVTHTASDPAPGNNSTSVTFAIGSTG